jgi:uncharacterized protein YhaN
MRIDRIHVDAFGLLRDQVLAPAPGLTVVRGANEAGKTTVLAFVRAMLFGFEKDRCLPPGGGRRGGWLDLSLADGRTFRVERLATGDGGGAGRLRVLDRDGGDGGAALLSELLHRVDEAAYRNIFAFGLEQLARFGSLSEGDVVARIYGAGLGTGAASALTVGDTLQKERTSIYRPSGQVQRLNRLLAEIEALEQSIRGRDLPAEHRDAVERRLTLEADLEQCEAGILAAGAEEQRLDRLIRAWAPWQELRRIRLDLAAEAESPTFAADAREALAALETASSETAGALDRAREARERAERELAALNVDEAVLARFDQIDALAQRETEERTRRGETERLERDRSAARADLDRELGRLGAGWDDARVRGFDASMAVRGAVTGAFGPRLARAASDAQGRESDVRAAERELAAARAELDDLDRRTGGATRAEGTGATTGPTTGPTAEGGEASSEIIGQRARLLLQLESALGARALLAAAESSEPGPESRPGPGVGAPRGERRGRRPSRTAVLLAATGGIGGLVVGGLILATGLPPLWAALALLAGAAAGTVLFAAGDRIVASVAGRTAAAATLGRQLADLDRSIRSSATQLGLPGAPSPSDVEGARRAIDQERQADAGRRSLLEQRRTAIERIARIEERMAVDRDALALALAAEDEARRSWRAWLVEHGLPADLDPGTAAEMIDVVAGARRLADALERLDERIRDAMAQRGAFEMAATALLVELDRGAPTFDQLSGALAALRGDLAGAVQADQARARAREALAQATADEGAAATRAAGARVALDVYLADHGAGDPAQLRAEIDRAGHRRELARGEAARVATLETLSGPGDALAALLADLETVADIATVKLDLSLAAESLPELRGRRDAKREELGSLRDHIRDLETSADASTDRQTLEMRLGMAAAEADRWTALALAETVLRRTRERYEREHQPAVVQIAERFLREWTEGRYRRIIAPLEGAALGVGSIQRVELANGRLLPITALSTGTAEQLYLALRLGLVEHFAVSAESLPLIMDDILVNFDPARAARAARSIEELSTRHQVLYFTCHPETPLQHDAEIVLGEPDVPGPAGA